MKLLMVLMAAALCSGCAYIEGVAADFTPSYMFDPHRPFTYNQAYRMYRYSDPDKVHRPGTAYTTPPRYNRPFY